MNLLIEPTLDHILIAPDKPPAERGGILLVYQPPCLTGTVLATGPGRIGKRGNTIPVSVQPGDRVLFERHMGTELKHDGQPARLISERFISAIIGDASIEFDPPPPPPQQPDNAPVDYEV